jgi:hypothetical protein
MDIGSLTGSIEIEDQVTGALGMIASKVAAFAEEFGGAFGAAAVAVGTVTAAVTAATAAITALGSRGADVNDVAATFENFSGGVEKAAANMKALQEGTLETVDKFDLMKTASKLLAAGVTLTADNFKTLSSAAFILQNQGLGPTKDMLVLVNQAMLTGRTRQLEMTIGKLHMKDAEAAYAKELGKTAHDLTEVEKLEAKRQGILDALAKKVKEAGDQQRDFGEQIEFVQAKIKDWFDEIASAVAKSEPLTAGMRVLTDAIAEAFGGDQKSLIEGVVGAVEKAVDVIMDVGLITVEAARVAVTAWSAMKFAVLSTLETLAKQTAQNVHLIAGVLGVAALVPGASSSLKDAAKSASGMASELDSLSAGLKKETQEAWLGVTGHSELHKTLDKIGGTIFRVKDAMDAAKKATEAHTGVVKKNDDVVKDHVGHLTEYEQKLLTLAETLAGKPAIDAAKDYAIVLKGLPDITLLTADAQKKIAKTMQDAIDVYVAAGKIVPKAWKDIRDAALMALSAQDAGIEQTTAALAKYGDALKNIPRAAGFEDNTWATRQTLTSRNLSGIVPQIDVAGMQGNFQEVVAALNKALKGVSLADALISDVQRIPGMVVSAFTGGGGIGGALQGIGSMLSSTLGKHIGEGVASLGKLGGPIGAAIGSLAGPIIGKIVDLFGTAGRDAIKAFGKELTGSNDLNKLHDLLSQQLPAEAEKYWKVLTQGTGRNNAAQAAANIQMVRDALANSPSARAEAAGYQTIEDLQAIADKAKDVYDYMLASGKYSASELARAFQASKDAQIAALGDTAKAHASEIDAIKTEYDGLIGKLKTELSSFSASLQAEADAPEYDEMGNRIYGVVELQQMARKKQLESEMAALEEKKNAELSAAEQVYNDWLEAGKTTDQALRELFQKPYKIPLEWYMAGKPGAIPTEGGDGLIPPGTMPTTNRGAPNGKDQNGSVVITFPGSAMAELVVPFIPGTVQQYGLG